jgi:eukaryotic-like serine/threonine-protein kinase
MKTDDWQKIKEIFNAAIDLPEDERATFLEKHDESICREVEKLIKAHETAEDFINESAFVDVGLIDENEADFYIGKQIDDYKIQAEIGHGGMGTVYLAAKTDETFDKKVAIKLIKRGMDTSAVLKRFVMERKILAQLENPNIASLLDGGSTADGLPYLVMEYIEGEPITKFCDSHRFSIEERLELFRKVCSAISYAHQNLVVHRDIKPSNILVTKDGTPKLLDFGIAKLLHPDWSLETDEATATMFRLMTPEYASPEQIRGLSITTASDVYSLGVVLYELLSGERPYKIESRLPQEVAQIILTEEPVKPSVMSNFKFQISNSKSENETLKYDGLKTKNETHNPKSQIPNPKLLRGDLDNIILKALRKEPERRYASVQEFSEDIHRHLVGLPVTATADTRFYRAEKFFKRHRVGVLVGVLFALTLISATAITTWQSIVARRERARAEQRFAQVRKLANTVLFDYHDEAAKLSGSTSLREKMVKNALEYLDNLAAESSGDLSLQSEIAAAYQKVGDVQGNPYQSNLGNMEGAIDAYRKSLAIREKLVAENPTNAEMRRGLAKSYEAIGDMFWTKGEYLEANADYLENLRIQHELSISEAAVVEDSFGMARARHRIGQALSRSGDLDGALESFNLSLELYQEIIAAAPDVKKYRLGKGSALLKIGDMWEGKGNRQAALKNHREALDIWSEVSSGEPSNAALKRNTAIATDRVAMDLKDLNDFPEALKTSLRAVEIQREISAADPQNVQFNSELGLYYVHLGNIQGKLKNFSAAQISVRQGLKILQRFADANPQWIDLQRDLALAYGLAGEVFADDNNLNEAVENYRHSAALLESAPLRAELWEKLAQTTRNIADIHQKANRFQEAKIWYQKSLEVWEDLRRKDKLSSEFSAKPDELGKLIEKCDSRLK